MVDFSESDILRMSRGGTVEPDRPVRKITIGCPRLEVKQGIAQLLCNIKLGCVEKEVFFSVDEKYADYLCCERGDAYLIGLLSLAMRERCDIHSEVPLTGELVYQLQRELIPSLQKYAPNLYKSSIYAKLDDTPLPSEKKIATGCSCGIDSMHAIKSMTHSLNGMYKPDYLVVNNVGAYTQQAKTSSERYEQNYANAQRFAHDFGVPLIVTNSNFAEAFPQDHLKTHLYSSSFAIYMLRKLWSRYHYASTGCDLEKYFGLTNNERYDSAKYDLVALPAFSISQLRICNEGLYASRFEKTIYLANDSHAQRYLNVCQQQGKGHCGLCPKCTRTLWTLDAIGKLDDFAEVFPIDSYKTNRNYYLRELYIAHRNGVQMISEAYAILGKEISTMQKLHAILDEKFRHAGWWHKLKHVLKKIR